MATLQERNGSYRVLFCWHGKRETFTLGKVSPEEAETKASQVDYLLMRLKQRLVTMPPGMGIVDFVQFDGKPLPAPKTEDGTLVVTAFRDKYLEAHTESLEANTLEGIRMHFRHLTKHFGDAFPIGELTLSDLQGYVDRRAKAEGMNGRKLSAGTIKKEIVSLRTAWNWGVRLKLVQGRFPYDGLRYPKSTEKPPFQTMAQVERQIAAGGLTKAEVKELHDSIFLQVDEIAELLAHVKQTATHGFLYPMFCFAAHTGARRSEIIRARVTDVDFEEGVATIREKKRVKGKTTTRRVPMSAFLVSVLKDWIALHPGGPWLFCLDQVVSRSKKRSPTTGHLSQNVRPKSLKGRMATVRKREAAEFSPLTINEHRHYFNAALADSKWSVLKGGHALRHSFVSALASRGVDQRLVESWAGHMSKEMSRRYAHLWPSVQHEALAKVFG